MMSHPPISYESATGMSCSANATTGHKWRVPGDGGPGISDIARLIRPLPLEADRRAVGEAFYRAFVFNVVAGCSDAHAKNYSLMLRGRSVRLAPLYDLLIYAAYWDGSARLDSAMSIGREYALWNISRSSLERSGKQFGVDAETAADIVNTVRIGAANAFESTRPMIDRHGNAALDIADALLSGLRKLPLVRS